MTEEELKEIMKKDLDEVFDVKNIIDFHFDLLREAYIKGLDTGLKAGKGETKWHKVADGDLPAENIYLIIRLNDENTCYKYCTGFWEKEEKCFHTLFCSVVDTKDIIAWKEIVPPKV